MYMGVFVAFIGALWPYTVAALDSFRKVPKPLFESTITLGKTKRQYVLQVLLPASMPGLFLAVKLAVPILLLLVVTTQYLYPGLGGLGALLFEKQSGLEYPRVFCIVGVLGTIGWFAEIIVVIVEQHVLKWKKHEELFDAHG
jgi:ABC-type nitrate/sulfonate/bicarbonate transport system permease component